MQTTHLKWNKAIGWEGYIPAQASASLVIYFGLRSSLTQNQRFNELRHMFPIAEILGCSSSGQIANQEIVDDEINALAVTLNSTEIKLVSSEITSAVDSRACGLDIALKLKKPDLAGIFMLSDGLNVNGSALVAGVAEIIGQDIPLTGGLAGDGTDFQITLVGANGPPSSNRVAALGFYGSKIRIGHGSAGGWDVFGPRRRISKSDGNILIELDDEPALNLYERYLGEEEFDGLPSTGLLFPLQIFNPDSPETSVVRTILGVNRDNRTMTFAGDMPEGWIAQLMRGSFDGLCAGASHASSQAQSGIGAEGGVAILVSCVGRRLLMGQRSGEEIEAAVSELGRDAGVIGFYSYGEISPHSSSGVCQLHNQTMTVTTFHEEC